MLFNGKWTGNPHGGVKAPQAVILPDPATRFSRTATRLAALAAGHPMAEWLDFMASLARAQHAVAGVMGPLGSPSRPEAEDVIEVTPPIAASVHRRAPIWREGLALLLDGIDIGPAPALARLVIESLRDSGADGQEALADSVLRGSVDAADVGASVFTAAALQVYFTRLAESLPVSSLRLLPRRGLCPSCGSTPVCGVVNESGEVRGARYLHCSLCATAWNHVRAVCITCSQSRSLALGAIKGDSGAARVEICGDCGTYAKMFYQSGDLDVDPVADDLATLSLDVLAGEEGWSRHASNPLLRIR
ncbi:formate dehydrogenase accessory protein FdhE [Reyranella soli]|uniref:Protein FdhE n=1 Tax=Reyranella soli TaxID=1230389 RepID=A0A512NF82_9HYPH|nr:formate dehydrogenase accessory protein FdhE [Reyranella soli]GEP57599.1 protein FdhE [Reyranella soli]